MRPGKQLVLERPLWNRNAGNASKAFCILNSSNFSEKQCAQTLTAPSVVKAWACTPEHMQGEKSNRKRFGPSPVLP